VVPDAESSESQERLAIPQLYTENHSEFAVRWRESQLHAVPKGSSFCPLLVAGQKPLNRHPSSLEFLTGRTRHIFPCPAGPPQVHSKSSVIE